MHKAGDSRSHQGPVILEVQQVVGGYKVPGGAPSQRRALRDPAAACTLLTRPICLLSHMAGRHRFAIGAQRLAEPPFLGRCASVVTLLRKQSLHTNTDHLPAMMQLSVLLENH